MTTERDPVSLRFIIAVALLLLACSAPRTVYGQGAAEEYKVKAAFMYHFAQLTEWPASATQAGNQAIEVCVFDDEPRRRELQDSLDGKLVGTRALQVRLLGLAPEFQGCKVLFVGRCEFRRQAAVLKSLRGQPVLTVGETDTFISDGGMIQFHLDEDRIRFNINVGFADTSHLKISSRLLLLATSVTGGNGAGRGR